MTLQLTPAPRLGLAFTWSGSIARSSSSRRPAGFGAVFTARFRTVITLYFTFCVVFVFSAVIRIGGLGKSEDLALALVVTLEVVLTLIICIKVLGDASELNIIHTRKYPLRLLWRTIRLRQFLYSLEFEGLFADAAQGEATAPEAETEQGRARAEVQIALRRVGGSLTRAADNIKHVGEALTQARTNIAEGSSHSQIQLLGIPVSSNLIKSLLAGTVSIATLLLNLTRSMLVCQTSAAH
jgi:hypothetical protein